MANFEPSLPVMPEEEGNRLMNFPWFAGRPHPTWQFELVVVNLDAFSSRIPDTQEISPEGIPERVSFAATLASWYFVSLLWWFFFGLDTWDTSCAQKGGAIQAQSVSRSGPSFSTALAKLARSFAA